MPPGEQDEEQLVDDVEVGDIEIVFQGGDVDETVKLARSQHLNSHRSNIKDVKCGLAYVLLDVFLAVLESRLAELGRYLRRRVIHELPVRAKDVARRAALLLVGRSAVALVQGLR